MMLVTCTKSLRKQRTNWCVKVVIRSIPKVTKMLLVPCRHIMKISWKSDDVFVSNIPSRHKFPQNTLTRWWFRTTQYIPGCCMCQNLTNIRWYEFPQSYKQTRIPPRNRKTSISRLRFGTSPKFYRLHNNKWISVKQQWIWLSNWKYTTPPLKPTGLSPTKYAKCHLRNCARRLRSCFSCIFTINTKWQKNHVWH